MNIMGIGTPEYEQLMKASRAQVRIALSTVGVEQGESDEAISENASQRFREVAESARILGADQFATLCARLKGITALTRRDCMELRLVLQELESVLTQQIP